MFTPDLDLIQKITGLDPDYRSKLGHTYANLTEAQRIIIHQEQSKEMNSRSHIRKTSGAQMFEFAYAMLLVVLDQHRERMALKHGKAPVSAEDALHIQAMQDHQIEIKRTKRPNSKRSLVRKHFHKIKRWRDQAWGWKTI